LLALLAVGRIILAKKPSLAPPTVDARELGLFSEAILGAIDAREDGLRAGGAALATGGRAAAAGLGAGLRTASSPCLAAKAAVGAVKWEGSRTGRVGDFGLGFLNPVGDVAVVLGAGAAEVVFAAAFFCSGAFALAAALAVVPIVDDFSDD
jgi:hypothetical protein